jgi:predicted ATPase
MVAIDDRPEARHQRQLGIGLVPVAAVYGPNASGKSNLIAAFTWLRDAIQDSLRLWEGEIPVEPFAFGNGPSQSTSFILELVIDGIRFDYHLDLTKRSVLYEALFHYPEGKRRRIFEREGSDLKLQRGLGNLSGTRELLTERTLMLSAARRFEEPLVNRFVQDFTRTYTLGFRSVLPTLRVGSPRPTLRWFDERNADQPALFEELSHESDRDKALALLKLADLGIDDVLIDTEQVVFGDTQESATRQRVRLVHHAKGERAPLDFRSESEGTKTWFRLIGPVLTALDRGSLLLFDELDASLHPTLSAQLIHLFHSPATNPRNAQIIFTSHDTSLLNHLNRDEVWLTEKAGDGATILGPLSEFAGERVRKSQNLENAYLHGRFGALPQVDQAEFLRALGLIG